MIISRKLLILSFIFLCSCALRTTALTYYVSTTGNDSNPGTVGRPFLTVGKAESVAVPGDLVMINNGTYAAASLTHSGKSGAAITFSAVNPGNVTLSGTLKITADYRVINGLVFNGNFNKAIWVRGANNIIQDVTVTTSATTGYGIVVGDDNPASGVGSNNNTLDNVRVIGTNPGKINGVLISGKNIIGNVLKNSYISNTYYGLVDKMTNGTKAYNNVFNNTDSSVYTSIYAKGATNSQYYNNIIRNTGSGHGVLLATNDGGSPPATGIVIKNNVFIKNNSDASIFRSSGGNRFTSDSNLFQYSSGTVILNEDGTNYSSLSTWQSASGQDAHSITGTPAIKNASGKLKVIADFQLDQGSMAIPATTTGDNGGSVTATGNTYYVSSTGNDANPGTFAQPWNTLQRTNSAPLNAGDIVYIRAGIYKSGSTSDSLQYSWHIDGKNGTASNPITIAAYPPDFASGGRVVFDCSDFSYRSDHFGIYIQNSSHLLIKGIRVTGIPQRVTGQVCIGWWVNGNPGGNITLENCEADHIGNYGFRLDDTDNMTFLNCDAHHIDNPYDPGIQKHGGSDGFGRYDPSNTSTNTIYKGCRAWFCSDDGWDSFGSPGTITYENCWAFWNGYVQDVFPLTHIQGGDEWGDGNGFKLGSNTTVKDYTTTKRLVRNCFSFENYNNGFDQNLADVKMEFQNNTAYKCKVGFVQYSGAPSPMIVKKNLTYLCNTAQKFISSVSVQSDNSWNSATNADFENISSTGANGARQLDGSLPVLDFMRLTPASNLQGLGAFQPLTGTPLPSTNKK